MATSGQDRHPELTSRQPSIWQSSAVNLIGRFVALLLVFLLFTVLIKVFKGKDFYSLRNVESLLRQSAVYATAALGMTMVIITAGIDLSVGSSIALALVVVAWVLTLSHDVVPEGGGAPMTVYIVEEWPVVLPVLAVLAGIAAATIAGLLNGLLIVGLRLVPFIVTLGTMGIIRGIARGIARDQPIYPPEKTWVAETMDPTLVTWWNWLSGAKDTRPEGLGWLILPMGVWVLIIASIAAAILLRYTRLGRHIYAIGSNEETARLCGVPVRRTKVIVYSLTGLFAGLAGLMHFSFIDGVGQPSEAMAYELYIIASVVIGGGSLMGGEGSILGSLVGAFIIATLYMGGQQMVWPQWVQIIVIGCIIIAAVAIDQLRHRHSAA